MTSGYGVDSVTARSPMRETTKMNFKRQNHLAACLTLLGVVWLVPVGALAQTGTAPASVAEAQAMVKKDPKNPKLLITVHGAGYKVVEP